jgi:ribosomal protein L7/L12
VSEPTPIGNPSTSFSAQGMRALPQVAGVVIGLVMLSRGGLTTWLGGALLVITVLSVVLTPRAWVRYVRTGVRPLAQVAPELTEPGPHAVVLQDAGQRPVEVVAAVREVTGFGLADAKAVVDRAPSEVVAGLSESSASLVRDRLERAGARAEVS